MSQLTHLAEEPTLSRALRVFAYNHFPSRFYVFLQIGFPASVQFWVWGWRRSAAWMLAIAAFGVWALCEQALGADTNSANDDASADDNADDNADTATSVATVRESARSIALRIGRRVAGFAAGVTAAGLVFEGFVRLMRSIASCPSCAG